MSQRLVTVATYQDPVAAALARNFLESEGIATCLLDEMTVATYSVIAGAIGGIKLQVAVGQLELAETLLAEHHHEPDEEDEMPLPPNAIAAREIAEDLQAELADKAEINKLVDRIFRASVFGLLFPPLLLYSICLLAQLTGTPGTISPERRWKVWASVLICLPAVGLIFIFFCGGPGTWIP